MTATRLNMKVTKRDHLKRLREARRTGVIEQKNAENLQIYEEVDEDAYRKHKRVQLMEDDFIVDDNGEGYVDNGADEWGDETRPNYYLDDDSPRKVAKVAKVAKVTKSAPIGSYFGQKPEKEKKADIDDILNSFDTVKREKLTFSFGRKKPVEKEESDEERVRSDLRSPSQTPPTQQASDDEEIVVRKPKSVRREESPLPKRAERSQTTVKKDSSKESSVESLVESSESSKGLSSLQIKLESEMITLHKDKQDFSQIEVSSDGKTRIFWLDYSEADGSLFLFGKVPTKNGFVSGQVHIEGMCRELFFLPKAGFTAMDVHEEVAPLLMENFGLETLKARPEIRKYAFELPGVPKVTEYLKVLIPFKTSKNNGVILPAELSGDSFERIFGANTGLFEAFVVQQNVMGPCWLELENSESAESPATHCQVAFTTTPSQVAPISLNSSPPLKVCSLAVQAANNAKANKQEVVCVTLSIYDNVPQDAPISLRSPDTLVTLVRPFTAVGFPPGLAQAAQKQGINIKTFPNETSLLGCLCALIKNQDPDVFLAHRLDFSLEVLTQRMRDLRVPTWSSLGRRIRKLWAKNYKETFQGRLLCDIANELGQSLTPKCQLWDLPEMYQIVCGKDLANVEINFQNPLYAEDAAFMVVPLRENIKTAEISAEVGFRLQILSLSKQLTNIAGNAWSHTLGGTRAGRNEYILLHEFSRNGYIVPDKEEKGRKDTDKKAKFQGGLVFEPEKGLHKNYVLVMDFNSLYPSIIQEFNICFTTVERERYNVTHDEEHDMPELPSNDTQGVLPRLLNNLVSRRREVKKLLQGAEGAEKAQYDIKQQALKLTANSMYGCLGYVNSRFYAKPLAMLVTNKGREILMDTRQLAELLGLRVVYGDTDSVMIDTGVQDLAELLKIGNDFKVRVNERYKLLEIDTDNVFKRLLLHAKKKYAALSVSGDSAVLEVKGLDMRRREYCPLSKEVSTFVLQKLLTDSDAEQALSEVYDYLESVRDKVRGNKVPLDRYTINTRLLKDPLNYPGGKTMPSVQVALRLRASGKTIKAGSVISFIICTGEGGPADRARPVQEVIAAKLVPDPDFYLDKQIFAPVERLVNRIDGIEMARVGASLGIDARRFAARARDDIVRSESTISDAERFRQLAYLVLRCECGAAFRFGGIVASDKYSVTYNGIACGCLRTLLPLRVNMQLETQIRRHVAAYYGGRLVCDDCGLETGQIGVYGKRCLSAGCKGLVRYKYTSQALYNQLLYFDSVFDVDKAKQQKLRPVGEGDLAAGQIVALAEQNRAQFEGSRAVVARYLHENGRRYVSMQLVFAFMI